MNGSVTPESQLDGYPQLPGVETASALRRLGQDRELYLDSLRAFADVHQDTPERLRRLGLGPDAEALRLLAHTLKGEAGNLGITAVRTAAGQLDAALRACSEREIAASTEMLADAVARSVRELQAGLPAEAAAVAETPRAAADAPPLGAVLTTLESQLADRSLRASDTLDRLEALLAGPEYRPFLAGLRVLMARLRFEEALQSLRAEAALRVWPRKGEP
ncbi:Hpt domain-containing protein [Methylococcus mesophilus]|uniref:Hpt domain-containing protein n=1 Tax=Methylococcus mesophilus TaxID=2993564 RepID=UPI00224B2C92|nr:Hpt domain-containing protein [Methylococcus mesophilus]UZR30068.1 Hpt domain-containing protein [Methylococcus mesophilus]